MNNFVKHSFIDGTQGLQRSTIHLYTTNVFFFFFNETVERIILRKH